MSGSRLNQGADLDQIVNKRSKWLFCSFAISRYLVKRDNSVDIPSGRNWSLSLKEYPIYVYNFLKLVYLLAKQVFSFRKTSFRKKSTHILLSTGSGYDLKNYRKYFLDNNVELILLEAFDTSQFINYNVVEIKSAFSFFFENLREANSLLRLKLPLDLRKKIVNHGLPRLATYTYHCAFLSAI